nr:hypothetical protein [Tanacetum cinerariifolium]
MALLRGKTRPLIEAARTMLADSLLPILFWAEAVNTACYVQNRVLVTKPHNKTPYELLHGQTPSIGFMRPFGYLVTILNTLDPLSKFKGKVDEGFLIGYSVISKAFRVFNSRTRIVQETLHANFLENKTNITGSGPTWLFDIDSLTRTMNYQPVTAGNQSNPSADAAFDEKEHDEKKPESKVNVSSSSSAQSGKQDDETKKKAKGKIPTARQNSSNNTNPFSAADTTASPTHGKSSFKDASQLPNMLEIEDITYSDHENVGAEPDFNNLETSITVSPIPTTRTHKDHHVSQIIGDLSSTTQTRSMTRVIKDQGGLSQIFNDDFHTCMLACFLSQEEPKRVYRNKKDERGIVVRNKARLVTQGHTQEEGIDYEEVFASVARLEAIRLFLAYASFMGFMMYQMDVKSAFLYETIEEEVYVCQPPGLEDPDHPDKVYKVVKGLLVKQKKDGIFISQDKYVAEILKKFGLIEGKSASTPIDTEKPLLKDPDVKMIFRYLKGKPHLGLWYLKDSPFDLVAYSDNDYAGASLDKKSTTRGCQFLGCRLISWQCKKQTVIATSSIEAEYVAAASCCAQVLWIQNQLMDYGYIKYALTVNPTIYVTCIKQFWNTVVVKQSNDVTRLQALVDRKKVFITKAAIRDILCFDDADGVDCLPDEEIFAELACMCYEKPSTKLTIYKAFFSSQWKFLIHIILQSMSAKRTSWNEFSLAMASAVICLSTGRKFNFSKYIFKSLMRNVDSSSKFYMYPRFIQLIIQNQLGDLSTHTTKYISPALTQKVFADMRRVGKGFLGVEMPLFEGMLVAGEPEEQGDVEEQETLDACATLTRRVEHLEHDKVAQALEITKLKKRVKNLERANKVKVLKVRRLKKVGASQRTESSADTDMEDASNQGRMIADLDRDTGVALMDDEGAKKKVEDAQEDEPEVQEVVEVVTTAKLITEVVAAVSKSVTTASATIVAVPAATITAAPVRVATAFTKRRKGVVIRDPEEESTAIIPAETNVAIDHVKQKPKEDSYVQRYQVMKKRTKTEAQARRNMIMYLKNVARFRLDYFKGMSYNDIRPIFEAKFNSNIEFLLNTKEQLEEEENIAIESINETLAQKAAKRRKLNEEFEELKQHLEIMPDEDDDVYTEATPLTRKVPVVDYDIVHFNNKPHYKIIRADETHQLYVSFITLLKNFNREDLESLWSLVKERFSTSKPNNFSDDYLLTTLGAMFERPDG